MQAYGLTLNSAVLAFEDKSPGELVCTSSARVAAGAADEVAEDFISGTRFAVELTEDLVTALVGPSGAAEHACGGVVEDKGIRAETDVRTRRSGEHQRTLERADRRTAISTEL